MKNISNKYLLKSRRMDLADTNEREEHDWISAITTPSKHRAKRVLERKDGRARDMALRELMNSRLFEEPVPKVDASMDDDNSEDNHLGDQTLESPLPCTPPRRSGYPLESLAFWDSSPLSSPTVTLALLCDVPGGIPISTSVDDWLCESYKANDDHHDLENTELKTGKPGAIGFLFGLGLASASSSYSVSNADLSDDIEEESGEDAAESVFQLGNSSSVGSCSGASTPTPTLA
ncbi:hypothetical protein L218DRAFT_566616 [Marasmius fiardii PR-910]|nr:hypothetical protein L218DRAFT_566616 [Marasmius fiardii PR-910]